MISNSKKISFFLIAGLSNDFVELMLEDYNKNANKDERINNCEICSKKLKTFLSTKLNFNGLEFEIKQTLERIASYRLSSFFTIVYCDDNFELLYKFYSFVKIIKPSNIIIQTKFSARREDGKYVIDIEQDIKNISYQNIDNDPFTSNWGFIDLYNISKQLKNFIVEKQNEKIQNSIELYLEADRNEKSYVKIILYLSVLEMLNSNTGRDSITVKIARLPAVLLGFDLKTSNAIYKNMTKIYGIRSKIVHEAKFDEATLEIAYYLSSLVSAVISTILYLDKLQIEKNETYTSALFREINSYGFGQRKSFFKSLSTNTKIYLNHTKDYFSVDLFPAKEETKSKKRK